MWAGSPFIFGDTLQNPGHKDVIGVFLSNLTIRPDQTRLVLCQLMVINMHITNISEAKANLSRLLREVQHGKPVIIGKAGKPIAVLSAYQANTSPRKLGGSWEGKVEIADDFDETMESVTRTFYESVLIPQSDET